MGFPIVEMNFDRFLASGTLLITVKVLFSPDILLIVFPIDGVTVPL